MYRVQFKSWSEWRTVRKYKTKRAAMVNLIKKKFETPDTEWRVSTEPDFNELIAMMKDRANGNQV